LAPRSLHDALPISRCPGFARQTSVSRPQCTNGSGQLSRTACTRPTGNPSTLWSTCKLNAEYEPCNRELRSRSNLFLNPSRAIAHRRTFASSDDEAHLKDRKSTRLNSSHVSISYAVFCLKKKKKHK